MTPEELDAIEARAKAATAGPWTYEGSGCIHTRATEHYDPEDEAYVLEVLRGPDDPSRHTANGRFVAAARTDVPALVAEVRSRRSEILCLDASVMDLRAERDALRAEVERLRAVTDAAKSLAAQIKHAEHCPGNRHLDCGPAENEAWCCVWCRSQEECLRRKADCDCHIAAWRELLGVPVAREDGR